MKPFIISQRKNKKNEKNQASVQLPTKSATELLKLTTLHTRDVCVGVSVPLLTESSPSRSLPRHCRQVQSLQVSLPHLSLAVSGNANWPSRAWQEPPHWTSCHMMPSVIVLLKSYSPAVLPLSQSSSPKLLSSVCVCERECARVRARLSSLRDVCGREQSGRLNQVVWLLERLGVSGMEARGSTVKNQHHPTHVIEKKCGNTKWEASPKLRSKF